MSEQSEIVNGEPACKGHGKRLADAQAQTHYQIGNRKYKRIRYGNEGYEGRGWSDEVVPCNDCAAAFGQLHVPGCDLERCPKCGGQWIACECKQG